MFLSCASNPKYGSIAVCAGNRWVFEHSEKGARVRQGAEDVLVRLVRFSSRFSLGLGIRDMGGIRVAATHRRHRSGSRAPGGREVANWPSLANLWILGALLPFWFPTPSNFENTRSTSELTAVLIRLVKCVFLRIYSQVDTNWLSLQNKLPTYRRVQQAVCGGFRIMLSIFRCISAVAVGLSLLNNGKKISAYWSWQGSQLFLWDVKCYPETVERARDEADLQCTQPRPVNWIDFCKEKFGGASNTSQVSNTKRLREMSSKAARKKQITRPHPHDVDSFTKETWFMHSTIVRVVYRRQDLAMDAHTTTKEVKKPVMGC
ncbi:hypothetical protein B0H11DRAFT_1910459 [Mycena galericulata]|nr:hypothetical protein B0H11DRAFT_1910459 [Mycena galericulata]